MSDNAFNVVIAALVKLLFRPKIVLAHASSLDEVIRKPSILVCNHTSHLDGPVLNTTLYPRRIHSLAAKDRFEQRGVGWFLRHTYCIPIERRHPDMQWIRDSLKVLHGQKESVAIFPEGRHGEHRKLLPFHSGAAMLALTADVPVVLVYIDGPHRMFRRSRVVFDSPVRIPRPAEGISSVYVQQQTDLLQERMTDLMDIES